MQEDRNAELHACFNRSYEAVLKPHLSFFVRPVVSVRPSVRPRVSFVRSFVWRKLSFPSPAVPRRRPSAGSDASRADDDSRRPR